MKHRTAVDEAIAAAKLADRKRFLPLIALCQTLASQMDESGPEVSTRLAGAYLSVLKDLGRALGIAAVEAEARAVAERSGKLRNIKRWSESASGEPSQ